ncbi:MAG TPA: NIPSNAP family protein [Bryobacteraceae bacterium]
MTRRKFVPAAAAAAAGVALKGQTKGPAKPCVYELRIVHQRNSGDRQRERMNSLLLDATVPALEKYGAGPFGFFSSTVAPVGPFLVALISYPSLAAMEEIRGRMNADARYAKQIEAFNAMPGLAYERIDSSLLRAFPAVPAIEIPPSEVGRPGRLFELRTYESNNSTTLRRKIKMFEEGGEIGIFRKVGMQVIFFAETIVGQNMPSLTYMLAYDDMAARERLWKAFGSDPDWKKLRGEPGLSDAEIVSNISNILLSPLAFSPIR